MVDYRSHKILEEPEAASGDENDTVALNVGRAAQAGVRDGVTCEKALLPGR